MLVHAPCLWISEPVSTAAGGAKKKAGRAEKKDGFDSLAAQYKAKLFGTGSASGSSPLQAMKRWFE